MKLPGIDYSAPVQSLGRRSNDIHAATTEIIVDGSRKALNASLKTFEVRDQAALDLTKTENQIEVDEVIQEGRREVFEAQKAERNTALTLGIINKVGTAAYKLYEIYASKQKQQENANAALSYSNAISEWTKSQTNTPEYNADELPDGVYSGAKTFTNASGEVVSAKVKREDVYPELFLHQQKQAIESVSQNISDPDARNIFVANQLNAATDHYTKSATQRLTNQSAELERANVATTSVFIDQGRYDDARTFLSHAPMNEATKVLKSREIDKAEMHSVVDNTVFSGDTEKMKKLAADVGKQDFGSIDKKTFNEMSDEDKAKVQPYQMWQAGSEERFRMYTRLNSAATQMEANRVGLNKEVVHKAVKDTDTFIDIVNSGQQVNPNIIAKQIQAAESMPNFPPEKLAELKKTQTMLPAIQAFHNAPSSIREGMVKQALDIANKTGSAEDFKTHQTLVKMDDKFNRELKDDPMKAVSSRGILPIESLDLSNPDSVNNRVLQASYISKKYGIEAPIATKSEIEHYSALISQEQNSAKKMELFRGINLSLGDKADKFLDSLGQEDISHRVLTLVDNKTGVEILEGSKIRKEKENEKIVPTGDKLMTEMIDKHFGETFTNDYKLGSGMYDAVKDRYAYVIYKTHDTSGNLDTNKLKQVLEGFPVVEIKANSSYFDFKSETKRTYLPPSNGVTSEMLIKDWERQPPNAFDNLTMNNKSDEDKRNSIVKSIFNGTTYLDQDTGNRSKFTLMNTLTEKPVIDNNGKPFVYEYGKKWDAVNTITTPNNTGSLPGVNNPIVNTPTEQPTNRNVTESKGVVTEPQPLSMTDTTSENEYPEQDGVVITKKPTRRKDKYRTVR